VFGVMKSNCCRMYRVQMKLGRSVWILMNPKTEARSAKIISRLLFSYLVNEV
jgi:hypothetical protein